MSGSYDSMLVVLSILIAIAASYTALDLSGRVRASAGWHRTAWLVAAALVMGGGIWAMHFVGMMAFRMGGVPIFYDGPRTAVSLLVAISATCISFASLSSPNPSRVMLIVAGEFMGFGVVAMHYLGMSAMRMPMSVRYDGFWVGISIAIALIASTTALALASQGKNGIVRVVAALIMGFAVSGMHYAGMHGAVFSFDGSLPPLHRSLGIRQTSLALSVGVASFAILAVALVSSMLDRRMAEMSSREAEALRMSEERFRSLYRKTPLPLHSLDEQGRIEQVSDDWLSLLDFSRQEVVGRPLTDFMDSASASALRELGIDDLASKGFLDDWECRFVTRSGEMRDVLLSGRIERDCDGCFMHHLGGLADVTERRRAEEALRQSQKIEAIGQLTGGVAHDFNNLLAVVVGNLDLIKRRIGDDPKLNRLVDSAMQGAERGASLTQRLLAFARRQDLKPAPVDIGVLVNGMSDLIQRSIGPRVKVETRFVMGLPPAQVDAHQLEMAILNLAVNARDAMPDGGVLVFSAAEEVVASDTRLLPAGRYVRIEVIDEGVGMDQETVARATEPFYTTKGVGKGTGLGLPMVQGLAAQSGGCLTILSQPDVGTIVSLWLPVADPASSPQQASTSEDPAAPLRPRSILVVDDDALVLDNTMAMLEDLGHRVTGASSGLEALEVVRSAKDLDLVLSDQLMPGMTGVQLAGQIAAVRPFLPFLLMSGYSDMANSDEPEVILLAKPFDQKALDAAIRRTLSSTNVVELNARKAAGTAS